MLLCWGSPSTVLMKEDELEKRIVILVFQVTRYALF